jgi:hypothetical protein
MPLPSKLADRMAGFEATIRENQLHNSFSNNLQMDSSPRRPHTVGTLPKAKVAWNHDPASSSHKLPLPSLPVFQADNSNCQAKPADAEVSKGSAHPSSTLPAPTADVAEVMTYRSMQRLQEKQTRRATFCASSLASKEVVPTTKDRHPSDSKITSSADAGISVDKAGNHKETPANSAANKTMKPSAAAAQDETSVTISPTENDDESDSTFLFQASLSLSAIDHYDCGGTYFEDTRTGTDCHPSYEQQRRMSLARERAARRNSNKDGAAGGSQGASVKERMAALLQHNK